MLLNSYNMSSLNIDLELLESISDIMYKKKLSVSVAESCTGGFVSTFFTYCSGASSFFKGSTINYSNDSKIKLLGIDESIIYNYGVVSRNVAEQMAQNVRLIHNTDYGLSTTGYVDTYYDNNNKKCSDFYAWISVSNASKTISQYINLEESRVVNIENVAYALMQLFRKEIF